MCALADIAPADNAMRVLAGSHKANYAIPPGMDTAPLLTAPPLRAGSILLFAHDLHRSWCSPGGSEQPFLTLTYCPGIIANSYVGDTLYDRLFAQAPEGSWRKYLLRRPSGLRDTYPQPAELPTLSEPLTASARG